MRLLTVIIIGLVLALQYRIWFGEYGMKDYRELQSDVARQAVTNETLEQRNQLIAADIDDLRNAMEAVEERARNELGLVRPDETFFRLISVDEQEPDA
ncbi:cell division protein FtsB [Aliidiomarina iranensis]|uniref:Cell division protein FtsB n=1 Tax=Aliidiomarina iranensis TaxID=1434071 RepID=A0A432W0G5_9GAMM|nr:cell division protein FtsB [Aliidiomarina iranensis]RUO22505.1 cell division protein FtsB [Aliidiomarina iranensis]